MRQITAGLPRSTPYAAALAARAFAGPVARGTSRFSRPPLSESRRLFEEPYVFTGLFLCESALPLRFHHKTKICANYVFVLIAGFFLIDAGRWSV